MKKMTRINALVVASICAIALSATSSVIQAAAVPAPMIRLKLGTFNPRTDAPPPLPPGAPALPDVAAEISRGARYHFVQFIGPVLPVWQTEVLRTGASIHHYQPDFALVVKMTPEQEKAVSSLAFVNWVAPVKPAWRINPSILRDVGGPGAESEWTIIVQPQESVNALWTTLERQFGLEAIKDPSPSGSKVSFRVNKAIAKVVLQAIANHDIIAYVEPYVEPKLLNNHSIWVGQSYDVANGPTEAAAAAPSEYPLSGTIWARDILGQNQVVVVCDSGVTNEECFFRTTAAAGGEVAHTNIAAPGVLSPVNTHRKIIAYNWMPGAADGDHTACTFHGTHVAGSVGGDNDANPSTATLAAHNAGDGMAPQAKFIVQDIGLSTGTPAACSLAGIPADLRDLFQQARASHPQARIHTNSWGSSVNGQYTANSQETDDFMFNNEDFLILFAASNDGPAADTIGSPGTAKNCITVAATSNGAAADRAQNIADFSSQGPTDDGRIKPDIGAPGTAIVSAHGDATACNTQAMNGTSMATPTMAGYAALARQYFQEGWYPSGTKTAANAFTPTSQLLKAVLYASSRAMTGIRVGGAALPGSPSNDQGWGRALLDDGLFFGAAEPGKMRVWETKMCEGIQTGQVAEYAVEAATGRPLHIVIAWNDAPGALGAAKALVNDLNLEVISPSGIVYHGNQWTAATQTAKNSTAGAAAWDNTNNSEGFQIASPEAGIYRVRVNGFNVPGYNGQTKQGYGLAAAGSVTTTCSLPAPGGVTATVPGNNQITISWTAVAGATRYAVYRAPEGAANCSSCMQQVGSTIGTTFTDTAVNGGFTYQYYVKTVSPCDGPASACVSAIATGSCTNKPTFAGLASATNAATATCGINLSWGAGTSNCPLATTVRYNIYRSTTPNFIAGAANRIATCITGTTFTDSGLTSGTTYYHVVRAEDNTTANGGPCGGGNEDTNNIIRSATPYAAGTGATGTWTDGGGDTNGELALTGSWSFVSNADQAGYAQAGIWAYKTSPGATNYPSSACAAATTPTLTVGAANPVVTFWERHALELDWDGVTVERSVNGGAWTVVTAGTTACYENAGNACAYAANTQGYEDNVGGAGTDQTAYTSRSFTITAAVGNTVAVRWRLSSDGAVEEEGFNLDTISISNIALPNACTACSPPAVPTGLTATPNGISQIDLSWTASAGATEYRVYRSDGACPGGAFTQIATVASPATTYSNTGLNCNTAYSYKVTAFATCESAQSACASATTATPAAPTITAIGTPSDNLIRITWSSGTPAGTSYNIYRETGACPMVTPVLLATGVTSPYDDTPVTGGQTYRYIVRAAGPGCASANSNCMSATATGGPGNASRGNFATGRPQDTSAGQSVRWLYNSAAAALNPPTLNSAVFNVSNDRLLHSMNLTATGGNWPRTLPKDWKPLVMNAPAQGRAPVWNVGTNPIGGATRVTVVASQDGRVYCANADTGALLWTSPVVLGDMIQSSPIGIFRQYGSTLTIDLIVVGTRNSSSANKLYALNAANGTIAWSFDNGGAADATRAIGIIAGSAQGDVAAQRLFFASRKVSGGSASTLWSINYTATGATLQWSADAGDVDGNPSARGTKLYVGNNTGSVYAFEKNPAGAPPIAATPLWSYATSDGPVKAFVWTNWSNTDLYFSTTRRVWSLADGGASATLNWSTPASGAGSIAFPTQPVQNGTFLWVGSGDGAVKKIDFTSGSPVITSISLGTAAVGPVGMDYQNALVHVGTEAGIVYAVAP